MKLGDIAAALSAKVIGDGALEIARAVHPADATGPADLAIALSKDALAALPESRAAAALIPATETVPPRFATIAYGGRERVAVALVTRLFDRGPVHGTGVHPTAAVAPDASLGPGVSIGPYSVIGPRTVVGAGSVILAQVTVGADALIGRDALLHPGVRIGDRVRLGDRVIVHFNTAIGSDGFSFIPVSNPDGSSNGIDMPMRSHSLGTVEIGDDVEIGAGTTIDRATLRVTRIGRGTKIDNQVQIGHNVTIGECCVICGVTGIAGSVVIGDRVLIAAGVGIADHVTVGEGATITAGAAVASYVPPGAMVSGSPAMRHEVILERYVQVGRLRSLFPRVDDLKKRVEALEKPAKGG